MAIRAAETPIALNRRIIPVVVTRASYEPASPGKPAYRNTIWRPSRHRAQLGWTRGPNPLPFDARAARLRGDRGRDRTSSAASRAGSRSPSVLVAAPRLRTLLGSHVLPGIIAQEVLRRPFVALVTHLIAALVSSAFNPAWALRFIGTALLFGAIQEGVAALTRYRAWGAWRFFVSAGVIGVIVAVVGVLRRAPGSACRCGRRSSTSSSPCSDRSPGPRSASAIGAALSRAGRRAPLTVRRPIPAQIRRRMAAQVRLTLS